MTIFKRHRRILDEVFLARKKPPWRPQTRGHYLGRHWHIGNKRQPQDHDEWINEILNRNILKGADIAKRLENLLLIMKTITQIMPIHLA